MDYNYKRALWCSKKRMIILLVVEDIGDRSGFGVESERHDKRVKYHLYVYMYSARGKIFSKFFFY